MVSCRRANLKVSKKRQENIELRYPRFFLKIIEERFGRQSFRYVKTYLAVAKVFFAFPRRFLKSAQNPQVLCFLTLSTKLRTHWTKWTEPDFQKITTSLKWNCDYQIIKMVTYTKSSSENTLKKSRNNLHLHKTDLPT